MNNQTKKEIWKTDECKKWWKKNERTKKWKKKSDWKTKKFVNILKKRVIKMEVSKKGETKSRIKTRKEKGKTPEKYINETFFQTSKRCEKRGDAGIGYKRDAFKFFFFFLNSNVKIGEKKPTKESKKIKETFQNEGFFFWFDKVEKKTTNLELRKGTKKFKKKRRKKTKTILTRGKENGTRNTCVQKGNNKENKVKKGKEKGDEKRTKKKRKHRGRQKPEEMSNNIKKKTRDTKGSVFQKGSGKTF